MPVTTSKVSDDEVEALLATEEGHFVDLKAIEISPSRVSDAVSAFANTSGGELFIGIDERIGNAGRERRWRGFPTQEDANGLIQTLESMSPLGNHYTVEFLTNDSELLLVLVTRPVALRQCFFEHRG